MDRLTTRKQQSRCLILVAVALVSSDLTVPWRDSMLFGQPGGFSTHSVFEIWNGSHRDCLKRSRKHRVASWPANIFPNFSPLLSRSICRQRIYLVCSQALCLFYFLCLSHRLFQSGMSSQSRDKGGLSIILLGKYETYFSSE